MNLSVSLPTAGSPATLPPGPATGPGDALLGSGAAPGPLGFAQLFPDLAPAGIVAANASPAASTALPAKLEGTFPRSGWHGSSRSGGLTSLGAWPVVLETETDSGVTSDGAGNPTALPQQAASGAERRDAPTWPPLAVDGTGIPVAIASLPAEPIAATADALHESDESEPSAPSDDLSETKSDSLAEAPTATSAAAAVAIVTGQGSPAAPAPGPRQSSQFPAEYPRSLANIAPATFGRALRQDRTGLADPASETEVAPIFGPPRATGALADVVSLTPPVAPMIAASGTLVAPAGNPLPGATATPPAAEVSIGARQSLPAAPVPGPGPSSQFPAEYPRSLTNNAPATFGRALRQDRAGLADPAGEAEVAPIFGPPRATGALANVVSLSPPVAPMTAASGTLVAPAGNPLPGATATSPAAEVSIGARQSLPAAPALGPGPSSQFPAEDPRSLTNNAPATFGRALRQDRAGLAVPASETEVAPLFDPSRDPGVLADADSLAAPVAPTIAASGAPVEPAGNPTPDNETSTEAAPRFAEGGLTDFGPAQSQGDIGSAGRSPVSSLAQPVKVPAAVPVSPQGETSAPAADPGAPATDWPDSSRDQTVIPAPADARQVAQTHSAAPAAVFPAMEPERFPIGRRAPIGSQRAITVAAAVIEPSAPSVPDATGCSYLESSDNAASAEMVLPANWGANAAPEARNASAPTGRGANVAAIYAENLPRAGAGPRESARSSPSFSREATMGGESTRGPGAADAVPFGTANTLSRPPASDVGVHVPPLPPAMLAGEATRPLAALPAAVAVRDVHQAVSAVLDATERLASGGAQAVNLRFSVGGSDLAVHVTLRGGEVQATFRTDSSELRTALALEWQAVSGSEAGRPLRAIETVFAPAKSVGFDTASGEDAPPQHRDPDGRQTGDITHSRRMNPPMPASPPAPVPSAPLPRIVPLATTRRLHTFA